MFLPIEQERFAAGRKAMKVGEMASRCLELEVSEVPGTHVTNLQRGNAHVVARAMRPHLERAANTGQPA
jgi:hypothetical protein